MGKEAFNVFLTFLLILGLVGTQCIIPATANPMPEINPVIRISNNQNVTYVANSIIFNFTASSSYAAFPIYYSLDDSDKLAVGNMTVISKEDANIGKNPEVDRTTVQGSISLSNLTKGGHNVTLYMVSDRDMWIYKDYFKGDVIASESVSFFVDTPIIYPSMPTDFSRNPSHLDPIVYLIPVSIIVVVVVLSVLLYRRHRKTSNLK